MPTEARRWYVARQPGKVLSVEDFDLRRTNLPDLGPDEVLVRGRYHLLSPSLRAHLTYRTYATRVRAGDPVPGTLLGQVEASTSPGFHVGDWVTVPAGWATRAVAAAASVWKLDRRIFEGLPPQSALGVLGINGMTAHIGLFGIGRAREGETVLISSAAGAVGSIVCQLAKLRGCRTVGIAGSGEKCQRLRDLYALDGTINHADRADLTAAIGEACPDGVDVFFDNVGGRTLEAAVQNLKDFGRAVICGRTATYADGETTISGFSPSRRLRLEGFIAFDHEARFNDIRGEMAQWVRAGRLRDDYTIIDGIENSASAFVALFAGQGLASPLVRID